MPGVRFPVAENYCIDTLAEWLRRQPAKLLGSTRAGSNPAGVEYIFLPAYQNIFALRIVLKINYALTFIRRHLYAANKNYYGVHVLLSYIIVPVAQRIRRETTNLKIAGSNPVGDTSYFCTQQYWFYGVIGYHSGL